MAREGARSAKMTVTEAGAMRIMVEAAPAWSGLFRRREGWTGADAIYAIPLSGYEGPGRAYFLKEEIELIRQVIASS